MDCRLETASLCRLLHSVEEDDDEAREGAIARGNWGIAKSLCNEEMICLRRSESAELFVVVVVRPGDFQREAASTLTSVDWHF